mmetsp:Transcript_11362/g.19903  ORF Transcript_11362/g.19903 Transcript_11362/m.19903 type:complete len:674 (-) Transcript_11362:762-2783(-)
MPSRPDHFVHGKPPQAEPPEGPLAAALRTGAWRLFPFLLLYSIGFATLFPVIPTLITNGFASQAAGHPIDCQVFTPATSPKECHDAHAQAVTWNSWSSFVSGSVLSFLCAPTVGRLSDIWGRKPFLLTGVAFSLAPMLVLLVHIWGWVAIEWYYVMNVFGGVVSCFSVTISALADRLPQQHMAVTIGYLSAAFSIGILVGPILGGFISTQMAVYVCVTMICATLVYLQLFFPESAPRLCALRAEQKTSRERASASEPGHAHDSEQGVTEPLLAADDDRGGEVAGAGDNGSKDCCQAQGAAGEMGVQVDAATATLLAMDLAPHVVPLVVPHVVPPPTPVLSACCGGMCTCPGVCDCPGGSSPAVSIPYSGTGGKAGAGCCGPATSEPAGKAGSAGLQTQLPRGAARHQLSGNGCQAPCARGEKCDRGPDMWAGFRIISNSTWYRKLAVVWIIVAMTWEGAQDMLIQYLQLQLGFTTRDQAALLVVVAGCGLFIKIALLPTLVRRLGEQYLLVLGLSAWALQDVLLALAPTKAYALGAIAVGSMACVSWPASMALQTSRVDPRDVGAVQGALAGISSLATGVGPLMFAALFTTVTRTGSKFYMPQLVWYVAASLALVAIAITMTLNRGEDKQKVTLVGVSQDKADQSTANMTSTEAETFVTVVVQDAQTKTPHNS